jgi:hypothetical protein
MRDLGNKGSVPVTSRDVHLETDASAASPFKSHYKGTDQPSNTRLVPAKFVALLITTHRSKDRSPCLITPADSAGTRCKSRHYRQLQIYQQLLYNIVAAVQQSKLG